MDNNTILSLSHVKKSTSKEIRSSILFLWFAIISGYLLFLFSDIFGAENSWLFRTSSMTFKENFSWITGTWGGILSIHGTIAALSITFMSMFIQQVSEAANKDFIFITRQLVLRKYRFYQFSTDAICGLLIGVFFLVIGGGVLHYSLSMACSIYFIIQYMKIFKHLYFITEKKEIIDETLLEKIKESGKHIKLIDEKTNQIHQDFKKITSTLSNFVSGYERDYNNRKNILIENPYCLKNNMLIDYNEKNLGLLNDYITNNYPNGNVKLFLSPCFYDPDFIRDAYIFHDNDQPIKITEDLIKCIQSCFKSSELDENTYFYNSFETSIIQSTLNAIISNNINQLNFCIETLYIITISSMKTDIFLHLQHIIIDTPTFKRALPETLFHFYESIINKLFYDYSPFAAIAFEAMVTVPSNIYEKGIYAIYSQMIHEFSTDRILYSRNDVFFNVYIKTSIANLVLRRYSTFNLNTVFLTKKIKYLSNNVNENLTERQIYLIEATKTTLSYISTRLTFLQDKKPENSLVALKNEYEEINELKKILLLWLAPEFLNEINCYSSVYDIILKPSSKYSDINDIFTIKESDSTEPVSIEQEYHEAVAICLLFFRGDVYNNGLNILYINNLNSLIRKNNLTTSFLDDILEVINSTYFQQLIELIESSSQNTLITKYESRKENILSMFEQIKSNINQIALDELINSKYDENLIANYNKSLESQFAGQLNEIIENTKKENVHSKIKMDFAINKRQIIPPIDGKIFSQESYYYSQMLIAHLVITLIQSLEEERLSTHRITTPNELPSNIKPISINRLGNNAQGSYKFYRGLRITEGISTSIFTENGFYYIDLNSCYLFNCNDNRYLHTEFKKATPQLLQDNYIELSEHHLETYVHMQISVALDWIPKERQPVYFISKEDCNKYLQLEAAAEKMISPSV
ncbi:hypothetical protein [Kosakonia radicincitans]|uniref:hypothetical protein n=1 Tax=Kosakonia radicincitans TaxID=283686 RepID=UPI0031DC8096